MGVVKNLMVRVGADVRGVTRGMKEASQATSGAERSIRKDTSSVKKTVKESFDNAGFSIKAYMEEMEATKASHQAHTAEVERVTDKLHQLEETFGTITNATDDLDLSKSLGEQIQAAEKDLEKINGKIVKTQTALDNVGTGRGSRKSERAATLRLELQELMGQSDAAAEHLRALDQAADRVGSANMANASAAGLKQLQAEIEATRNRLATVRAVVQETGDKLSTMSRGQAVWLKLKDLVSRAGFSLKQLGRTAIEVAGSGLKHLSREFSKLLGSAVRGLAALPGKLLSIGKNAASGCGGLNKMVRSIRNIGIVSLGMRVAGGMFGRLRSIISSYISTNESLNASATSLRNQMGEALLPAINLVIGAMQRLMPVVQQISGAINAVFTAIFGKAKSTASAVKSTASQAASAAKSLETYGFDQITKVSDNSSGGGSGTAGSTGSTGVAQSALVDKLTGWIQELKRCFVAGDWVGLGQTMASGIRGAFDAIFAVDVGDKVSSFINNTVTSVQSFLKGLDLRQLGQRLGSKLSEAVAGVDWNQAGMTIANALLALSNTLRGFMEGTDWSTVGQGLSGLLRGALQSASEFVRETDWLQLGRSVKELFANVDWNGLMTDLCGLFGQVLGGIGAFLWGLLEDVAASIGDHFSKAFEENGTDVIAGFLWGILTGIGDIAVWIFDNMLKPFINGFKKAFEIHSPSAIMARLSEFLPEGILEGISRKWHVITDFLRRAADGLGQIWKSMCQGVKDAFSGIWEGVKPFLNKLIGGVESMANFIIRGVNKIIDGYNKIAGLGEVIGLDLKLGRIGEVSLPRLAQGAVLRPNRPFAAIVGDQSSGVNVETPLSVIQEAVADVLQDLRIGQAAQLAEPAPAVAAVSTAPAAALGIAMAEQLAAKLGAQAPGAASRQPVTIPIYLGGRKVTEVIIDDINSITRERGLCPIQV